MVPRVEQYQCHELSRMLDELSTKDGSSFMSSSMKVLSRAYRISTSVPCCRLLKFCNALNKRYTNQVQFLQPSSIDLVETNQSLLKFLF